MGRSTRRSCFSPRYPKAVQEMLVQNVFLTGGNMMYPGMKVRIEKELLEMRPFRSSFQVLIVHVTSCFENSTFCPLIAKLIKCKWEKLLYNSIIQRYPLLAFLWLFWSLCLIFKAEWESCFRYFLLLLVEKGRHAYNKNQRIQKTAWRISHLISIQ